MRATWAIFLDAYRELNSKKLFWIVLFITLSVVIALALPSNNDRGISIFGATAEFPILSSRAVSPRGFYTFMFSWIGINLWLAWGATILALISTSGMIPDLVSSGSIELSLSRPISRVRLLLTKYAAGLMFVALQAGVFAVGTILVLGVRADAWSLKPLLIIPIVTVFFSYLFSICTLVGLVTRSTLLALLATVIVWLGIWAVQTTEGVLYTQRVAAERLVTRSQEQINTLKKAVETVDQQIAQKKSAAVTPADDGKDSPTATDAAASDATAANTPEASPTATSEPAKEAGPQRRPSPPRRLLANGRKLLDAVSGGSIETLTKRRESLLKQIDDVTANLPEYESSARTMVKWHRVLMGTMAVLPKTGETKGLFERYVQDKKDVDGFLKILMEMGQDDSQRDRQEAQQDLASRSLGWILGTSLAFEAVVLGLACLIFARRDF